jgi:hypothetical protein
MPGGSFDTSRLTTQSPPSVLAGSCCLPVTAWRRSPPHRGRPGSQAGTRELVAMPPYVIVYRVTDEDVVTILRIWHAAQDRR